MPCGTNRKPVSEITDRAKRYRANQPGCRPPPPKRCALCGSARFCVVDHVDGDEANNSPANLRWLCKAHNTSEGFAMKREGIGVRTRQYNPGFFEVAAGLDLLESLAERTRPRARRNPTAPNLAAYLQSLAVLKGEADGDFAAARQMIHDTPAEDRSSFAREIWRRRRAHGTSHTAPF